VILITDTGSWTQLEPVAEYLASRRDRIISIDHHAQGDEDLTKDRFVDVPSAAVCQPVAELCRVVLGKASLSELPKEVAEPLYLGLATDTGWFRHSNVNASVMRTASGLLEAGADHVRLLHATEQNSLGRIRLIGKAIASLELHSNDRIATMVISRADMQESGATPGDTGGITDFSQSLGAVRVSAMLNEALPGDFGAGGDRDGPLTKISLRSKSIAPAVDVNAIAVKLGGGGHVRAAGARMAADIATTRRRVVELIEEQLREIDRG
jgi:phosphoesterase RecJ-like protein